MQNLKMLVSKIGKKGFLIMGTGLVLVFALWYLNRPLSPDMICRQTIEALKKSDVDTLIRLTNPIELEKMGLTREKTRSILQDIKWSNVFVGKTAYKLYRSKTPDTAIFEVKEAGTPEDSLVAVYISTVEDQKTGWHLSLTNLLFYTVYYTKMKQQPVAEWKEIRTKYELLGVRQWDGSDIMYGEQARQ
ncbi:MAG: hypothetical protein NT023_02290 [Armatimonadetes bacterium]|nr:hypothetical protein [Armatimonadota bacterium]